MKQYYLTYEIKGEGKWQRVGFDTLDEVRAFGKELMGTRSVLWWRLTQKTGEIENPGTGELVPHYEEMSHFGRNKIQEGIE